MDLERSESKLEFVVRLPCFRNPVMSMINVNYEQLRRRDAVFGGTRVGTWLWAVETSTQGPQTLRSKTAPMARRISVPGSEALTPIFRHCSRTMVKITHRPESGASGLSDEYDKEVPATVRVVLHGTFRR